MVRVKISLSGKDASFLANSHRYASGLSSMELLRSPPDRVPSAAQLSEAVAAFQQVYEAAANGDRVLIAQRKKARKNVTDMFKTVQLYIQAVANEDDVPALLQAGFQLHETYSRRKPNTAPVAD